MVNKELIDLCRLVVAAIQDTNSFDVGQLRKLLLHIVPQLLAEIDILAAVVESLSDRPDEPAVEPDAVEVAQSAPPAARRPVRAKKSKARSKAGKKKERSK
jgi:hypothetical protein